MNVFTSLSEVFDLFRFSRGSSIVERLAVDEHNLVFIASGCSIVTGRLGVQISPTGLGE